uniref:Brain my040 protein n=2 Tax=Pan TaxID=9596 RepID=G2HHV7_PANTR|nr:brain my040 protein [Pan troglodytes]
MFPRCTDLLGKTREGHPRTPALPGRASPRIASWPLEPSLCILCCYSLGLHLGCGLDTLARCFPSLKDHSPALPVVRCLETIVFFGLIL